MANKNLDKALDQFKKDFGFSFQNLIDDPDKYSKKIKNVETKSQYDDTKHFSELYDGSQIKLYLK